jgi:hypothetical protein
VPEESKITLEIFDSKEDNIKTLIDEVKEPGTYQVEFNPNGFDEGIYLFQLTAGSIRLTKKMVLLR